MVFTQISSATKSVYWAPILTYRGFSAIIGVRLMSRLPNPRQPALGAIARVWSVSTRRHGERLKPRAGDHELAEGSVTRSPFPSPLKADNVHYRQSPKANSECSEVPTTQNPKRAILDSLTGPEEASGRPPAAREYWVRTTPRPAAKRTPPRRAEGGFLSLEHAVGLPPRPISTERETERNK